MDGFDETLGFQTRISPRLPAALNRPSTPESGNRFPTTASQPSLRFFRSRSPGPRPSLSDTPISHAATSSLPSPSLLSCAPGYPRLRPPDSSARPSGGPHPDHLRRPAFARAPADLQPLVLFSTAPPRTRSSLRKPQSANLLALQLLRDDPTVSYAKLLPFS